MLIYLTMIDSAQEKSKFEKIYQEYRGLMLYVADRVLHNQWDAEDAVHNAFVKIAENISVIDEAMCPRTKGLVITITEHTAIDLYRKKRHNDMTESLTEIPWASVDFEGGTILAVCIGKLPAHYRQVILLKYAYGFSNKEIAKLMAITESNVAKLGQRAKKMLRDIFVEEGVSL